MDDHPFPPPVRATSPGDRPGLSLSLTVRRALNVLAVGGELDLATAPRLDRVLHRLELTSRPLTLDLSDLVFADCAGWRVVEAAAARRRDTSSIGLAGGDVHLMHLSRQVRRLVSLLEQLRAWPQPRSGDARDCPTPALHP